MAGDRSMDKAAAARIQSAAAKAGGDDGGFAQSDADRNADASAAAAGSGNAGGTKGSGGGSTEYGQGGDAGRGGAGQQRWWRADIGSSHHVGIGSGKWSCHVTENGPDGWTEAGVLAISLLPRGWLRNCERWSWKDANVN